MKRKGLLVDKYKGRKIQGDVNTEGDKQREIQLDIKENRQIEERIVGLRDSVCVRERERERERQRERDRER